jgi:hypothetical protein
MQAMNTEQTYYPTSPGSQQAGAEFLLTNGIHPRKYFSKKFDESFFFVGNFSIAYPMRNPNTYSQTTRMPQQVNN